MAVQLNIDLRVKSSVELSGMKPHWHIFQFFFQAIDWLNECCLISRGKYVIHIQEESIIINDEKWWMNPALYFTDTLRRTSSCKQQSSGRHVILSRHIILTLGRSVYKCCANSGEAANTNFHVFCLTRSVIEPTTFHSPGNHANHYTSDAFFSRRQNKNNFRE